MVSVGDVEFYSTELSFLFVVGKELYYQVSALPNKPTFHIKLTGTRWNIATGRLEIDYLVWEVEPKPGWVDRYQSVSLWLLLKEYEDGNIWF